MGRLVIAGDALGQLVVVLPGESGRPCDAGQQQARRFDPFVLAASACCARASALRRTCLGFSMTSPADKTAMLVRPRSIPTSLVVAGNGAAATSSTDDAQ